MLFDIERELSSPMRYAASQPLASSHLENTVAGDDPRVTVTAADHYFALGLQVLAEEVVKAQSHWRGTRPLVLVYHRGMLCAHSGENEGAERRHALPRRASLPLCRRVLIALLSGPIVATERPMRLGGATAAVTFTPREQLVLQLLRTGRSQTEVGVVLGLSVKTVNAYKQLAMRKLGFKNNRQLQYWLLAKL